MTWPVVKLGEVCEINPRAPKGIDDEAPVSFLSMSAVSENGYVQSEDLRRYGDVKKGYTYFEKGDVLVAKITPCFENGKASCTDAITHQLGFGSTEFHVVRPGPSLDARFIFYLLWSAQFRIIGEKGMTGSAGQKRVPAGLIRNLEIPLPPLEEQKRIAAILVKADQLRQKRRQAIALLDSLTQSIFVEMFGTARSLATKWPDQRFLSDVANISSGITKGRKLKSAETTAVPYLAVANVQDKALNLKTVKTIDATSEEIHRYRLEGNDLLLTEGGDPDKLGRGVLWHEELPLAIHQNHIFRVRFISSDVDPLFANWLIGSEYGKSYFLKSAKQTTGIASINKSQLSRFPLILPPIEAQREFSKYAKKTAMKVLTQERNLNKMESLFSSLQSRAFQGDI